MTPSSSASDTESSLPSGKNLHTPKKRKQSIYSTYNESTTPDHVIRNSICAGSLSGIASTLVVYPFDVLRTKMQAQTTMRTAAPGPLSVLTHTWQHGGVRALYTGLSLPLQAQAIYKATVFGINQVCQGQLLEYRRWEYQKRGILKKKKNVSLALGDHFACGFIGGAINAAIFVTPVEFVRNQLIVQHTKMAAAGNTAAAAAAGPMDVIKSTMASPEGVRGLWRGMGMTVARDSLGCGCFFVSMAYCRQLFTKKGEQPTLGVTVLSGACAGLGFWAIALPLDTLKTWVQNGTATSARAAVVGSISSHGYVGTAQQLCRGWQVAFGRGAPSAAITICTYEFFYRKMEQL
jgi:hypothetical protein